MCVLYSFFKWIYRRSIDLCFHSGHYLSSSYLSPAFEAIAHFTRIGKKNLWFLWRSRFLKCKCSIVKWWTHDPIIHLKCIAPSIFERHTNRSQHTIYLLKSCFGCILLQCGWKMVGFFYSANDTTLSFAEAIRFEVNLVDIKV